MHHLFDHWEEVSARVSKARHIFLLLDFDGTLTPIVGHPGEAVLSKEVRRLLRSLAKHPLYTVGVISGRALKDLRKRVGIKDIIYAGNHGMEIYGRGLSFVEPRAERTRAFLQVLHHTLHTALKGIEGVFLENKGLSLSVHYRMAAEKETPLIKGIFDSITRPWNKRGTVRVTYGKKVYEVRPPATSDKGKAIEWLLAAYSHGLHEEETSLIFVGDDLTDEDGFIVVKKRGGLPILVGDSERASNADCYLSSPQEVGLFLKRLLEMSVDSPPARRMTTNQTDVPGKLI